MRERPGLTVTIAKSKLLPLLPENLFPGGAKAVWWLKAAQLDQGANCEIQREISKPRGFYCVDQVG